MSPSAWRQCSSGRHKQLDLRQKDEADTDRDKAQLTLGASHGDHSLTTCSTQSTELTTIFFIIFLFYLVN
jgi:hypothetical protein